MLFTLMKTKYLFKTMEVVGETLAIPAGDGVGDFQGALRVNEVTADILNLLQTDTTEEAVIEAMLKEYSASRAEIAESVHMVISTLREEGLLEE